MNIQEIRDLWKAQPFEPFRIHVADGRMFAVPHPDFLFLAGGGHRKIIVNAIDNKSFHILDTMLITGLEVLIPEDESDNHESTQNKE